MHEKYQKTFPLSRVLPEAKSEKAPPFAAQRMGHPGPHSAQPDGRVALLGVRDDRSRRTLLNRAARSIIWLAVEFAR
jgi:hypothetical protein